MNGNTLAEGVIWKKLLQFFFPILFGMLFQQLYNTADAVIVGKFVGTTGLAAVGGSAAMIINLIIGFFNGLSSGATVAIAQHYGAKDDEAVSRTVHTAICLSIAAGAVMSAVCIGFAPQLLRMVHEPDELIGISTRYLRLYFAGAIPLLVFNIGSGVLRAVGDSKHPLYYLIFCCLLNIVLDLVCVCVFKLGAEGAAIATAAAQTVSAVMILRSLARSNGPERLWLSKLKISRPAMRRILYVGLPSGVQSMMYSVSNLILQAVINGFGTTVIAAWTASSKIDGVFWATSNAFGMAICAFVSQNYGAQRHDRVKKSVKVCLAIDMGTTIAYSVLILGTAKWTLRVITDDAAVIAQCIELLWYFVPYYAVWVFIEIFSNALRGVGDSIMPTIIIMLGVCMLRVLWVVLVVPRWHTVGCVSMSYPISWAITSIAISIYYLRKMAARKTMTPQGIG